MLKWIATIALVIVGCSGGKDSPTAPTPAELVGVWNLQSVNGKALPATLSQDASGKVELLGDVLTFTASGTYTRTAVARLTSSVENFTLPIPDAGSYVLSGTKVTLTSSQSGYLPVVGTVAGTTLTTSEGGFSFLFTKQ